MLDFWNTGEKNRSVENQILFLDQLDSFSYNIIHLLEELLPENASVLVIRYDDLNGWDNLFRNGILQFRGLVIGPGPGRPSDYPRIKELLLSIPQAIPVFGVCLGMQLMGELLGLTVTKAKMPIHGKMWSMVHDGTGFFAGIESPMAVARYHSLVVDIFRTLDSLPTLMDVSKSAPIHTAFFDARTKNEGSSNLEGLTLKVKGSCDQEIMAIEVDDLNWSAVQFHPESVLTPDGKRLVYNWVNSVFG